MAVNDTDLELLHAYLDSELPVSECEGLWRRLAIERDLMAELDHLREDHAVRSMVWNSLEPDDASIARLQAKLMRATRREDFMSWTSNALRIVASAAALILFGFTVGWLGRDRFNAAPNLANMPSSAPHVAGVGDNMGIPLANKVAVEVRDRSGKLVMVKQFDSMEDARLFVQAVQAGQLAAPSGGDSNVIPSMDKF
ncbi:MAG: hypothetical protein ABSH08_00215 [Tepidisphaeraceae bacterium]|jgi:anti-sigma factor RsiW